MSKLIEQHCVACRADAVCLTEIACTALQAELSDRWSLGAEQSIMKLSCSYSFKNWASAMGFAEQVSAIAERENHHPELTVEWGKVQVKWWTHKIGGLHMNDFVCAAKCDQAYTQVPAVKGDAT